MVRLSKQEKEWRAQDDARILMEAESIKSDTQRKKNAIAAAKNIIKDKEKEVKAAKSVVGNKRRKATRKKTRTNKK